MFLLFFVALATAAWTETTAAGSGASADEMNHVKSLLSSLEFYAVTAECGAQVVCADGHVVALELSGVSGASGHLTSEIGYLTSLTSIDLSGSGLTSTIPEAIGRLSRLSKLHLQTNSLDGNVPHAVADMKSLVDLDLSDTEISGVFPLLDDARFAYCDLTNTCMDCSKVPSTVCRCSQRNSDSHPYWLDCRNAPATPDAGFLGLSSSIWTTIGTVGGVFLLAGISALVRFCIKHRRENAVRYIEQPTATVARSAALPLADDQPYHRLADALTVPPPPPRPSSPAAVDDANRASLSRPTSPAPAANSRPISPAPVANYYQQPAPGMLVSAGLQQPLHQPQWSGQMPFMQMPLQMPMMTSQNAAAAQAPPQNQPAVASAPASTMSVSSNGYVSPYVTSASNSASASAVSIDAVSSGGGGYVDPSPALVSGNISPRLNVSTGGAQTWTIDSAELELGAVLGEGAFGVVRSGKWRGRTVAIKQIKRSAIGGEKALAEFELEIGRMASLQPHENVVQLYGVVHLPSGDVGAVVEYCASGALVTALYGAKPRQWLALELAQVAYDSACGIMHLHANNVIHRDIAARNVLLAGRADLTAKVADFGMSRSVEAAQGYNELATVTKIGPAKHMAPEQLQRLAYSKASDVFAFAVLLFEIFAREEPWKGIPPINVITKVVAGERMAVPAAATPVLGALIEQCWAQDPAQRPHMRAVCKVLEEEVARQQLGN
jgi:hypothetical protein